MEWDRCHRRQQLGIAARLRVLAAIVFSLIVVAVYGQPTASPPVQDAVAVQREYNVKAASLYGFSRYATWPADVVAKNDDPFLIGIFGPDAFGGALDYVAAKKTVQGKALRIERFDSASSYKPCQILFVSRDAPEKEVAKLLAQLKGQPVLIVGDEPDFANQGGVISFYLDEGSVRFRINASEAQQRGIRINAKLLTLGTPAETVVR